MDRAGTSLTITCDSRYPGENRDCIDAGSAYTVGVRARNANGESAWANSAPAQPSTAAPDPVAEVRVTHNGSNLTVSWDAPARATHYDVTYTDTGSGQNARAAWNRAGTNLTIACDSRWPGQDRHCIDGAAAYRVGVRARNAAGESAWANSAATARPALSVADATVDEPGAGQSASLDFVVTLDPASTGRVTVAYATGKAGDTATAGSDYTARSGTLTFAAGETSKTVSVPVLPDPHDDGGETLTLTLSNASGARIADGEATGTITNDGPMPKAWIARFGRTVADQVIGAVESRMQAPRTPGTEVRLAGERLEWGAGGEGAGLKQAQAVAEAEARREAARLGRWRKGGTGDGDTAALESRTVTERELLFGSSFALTSGTAGGGSAAVWGQDAVTRFDGREGDLSLDGEVATALLGADWSWGPGSGSGAGRATAGLMVGHSMGEGGYRGASGGGKVSSTLTGLYPWGRYAVSERVTVWGVAGWGEGSLELTPEGASGGGQATLRADLDLAMGAAGLRGTLLDGGGDGLTLATKTDAMAVRTSTGRGRGAHGGTLAASEATVTRLRLGLEASRPVALGGGDGAVLTPSLEVGVRQDGGDAETGFGFDLGGSLVFSDPGLGVEAELRARGLLTHEAGGFRERGLSGALNWRQRPDSDRGATLSLTQTVGGSASGGAEALLSRTTLDGLAANDAGGGNDLAARRLEAKLGYGLASFGGRFTLTPEAGAGFADTGRDYRLGLRLTRPADAGAFELILEAARREAADDPAGPVHDVRLGLTARF